MFPDIAASISASLGLGFAASMAAADMIPRLAVAALGNFLDDPGLLKRMAAVYRQTFNSSDSLSFDGADLRDARTDRLTIEMDRAGAALRDAAAELSACQAEIFTEHPKQGSVRINIYLGSFAVHDDGDHGSLLLK